METEGGLLMNRRAFLRCIGVFGGALWTVNLTGNNLIAGTRPARTASAARTAQPLTRDLQVDISVNQRGFLSAGNKTCVLESSSVQEFEVIRLDTGVVAFRGRFQSSQKDFGTFSVGDFSKVREPGTYYIKAGPRRSYPFQINDGVYDSVIQKIVSYFSSQRCGPSTTGYLSPCHSDDGVRKNTGEHQDVTGGWHDASDLRKWVGATLYGMIGLGRLAENLNPHWDTGEIMDELRWGNRYFLNMQEPEGYVMRFIGGDLLEHGDSNRWTDNIIGETGGTVRTVEPETGASTDPMTIYGRKCELCRIQAGDSPNSRSGDEWVRGNPGRSTRQI